MNMYDAFWDELEKMAAVPPALKLLRGSVPTNMGFFQGFDRLFARLKNPVEGMREGYRHLAPRAEIAGMSSSARQKALRDLEKAGPWDRFWSKPKHMYENVGREVPLKEIMTGKYTGPAATKLRAAHQARGTIPMMAEELSRRGITGGGKMTKYLPMGSKAMLYGFPMMAIPSVVNAPKPTPTGEGGALENVSGELGGGLGFIAGAGLGAGPGLAAALGGYHFGGKAGRILDRLRGGANLRQAITAPSPTEAAGQLENISRNYGA